MGICLGWTQQEDIAPETWDRIRADFELLAEPYQEKLARQADKYRVLGITLFGAPPSIPYRIVEISPDRLVVLPSAELTGGAESSEEMRDAYAWQVDRESGDNWFRQNNHSHGMYHGEMLMATLLLIERHAPGVILVTQNDYEPGCWQEAAEWMEPVVGGPLQVPRHEEDFEDEEDASPAPHRAGPKK